MITIDMENAELIVDKGTEKKTYNLGDPDAFKIMSEIWLRCGWDTKYVYGFTWLGRPIIQLPEDMVRIQEVIYSIKPDVIIETGIAHGGSLIFYASLFKAMGRGRVIGVDIEIRPHNRREIERHTLFEYITLIEGSSIATETIQAVGHLIKPDEKALVILDSNHTSAHVLAELRAYSKFVSVGSYIVACDGIMAHLGNAPRTQPDWHENNPLTAIREFLKETPAFVSEEPAFPFNEGLIKERVTYWPNAWLRRVKKEE